jgi:hypothetical protein
MISVMVEIGTTSVFKELTNTSSEKEHIVEGTASVRIYKWVLPSETRQD